jgi:protein-L-isoaspartate(D-aspartate) O-methyltransferase
VPAGADEARAAQRSAMIETVDRYARAGSTPIDKRVLDAMAAVPREELVPAGVRPHAYDDSPLPIGHGQTISQPYIVALMTELADVAEGEKVLEVGTGSGYQAAVLAKLGARVFTIEIVEPLAKKAGEDLARLGFRNVTVRPGDGYGGWPEHAPFDAVVVTAAPDEVPAPLLQQLAPGGKLVIPVGPVGRMQHLTVMEKAADGTVTSRVVIPVRFVPLTRSTNAAPESGIQPAK